MKNINENDDFIFLNINGHDEPIHFLKSYFNDLCFHEVNETDDKVTINSEKIDKSLECVECESSHTVRSTIKNKKIRHLNFKSKKSLLIIKQTQYLCRKCGHAFYYDLSCREKNTNITKQLADKILNDFLKFGRHYAVKENQIYHGLLYTILKNRNPENEILKTKNNGDFVFGIKNAAKFADIPELAFKKLIDFGVINKEKSYRFTKEKLISISDNEIKKALREIEEIKEEKHKINLEIKNKRLEEIKARAIKRKETRALYRMKKAESELKKGIADE